MKLRYVCFKVLFLVELMLRYTFLSNGRKANCCLKFGNLIDKGQEQRSQALL